MYSLRSVSTRPTVCDAANLLARERPQHESVSKIDAELVATAQAAAVAP